jgi:methionyl-tRNA synthetase
MRPRFTITTAIDYVNSKPHLGTAFEKIGADAIARYRRRRGYDVLFLMGNDEHSLNVQRAAKARGLDPVRYCDEMEEVFRAAWSSLYVSFDDFVRTTQPRHRVAVETLFRKVDAAGDLYEGPYEGFYCESCEAFKKDDELDNGACKIHGAPCAWIREQNTFFRLSKYTDVLKRHFHAQPQFMEPERYRNEMLALLDRGLEDVSVSRQSMDWGISMPGRSGQVVWVWFDALINYVSALGYGSSDRTRYERYWPADVHVVGKDINRFHSLIWPAMLMSAGEPLPRKVWAHGWVHYAGQKMSKSRGTAVGLDEAIARHGADALRYFLLREVPFDRDGDFTWERFDERYNTDLANTWGNLLSRVLPMVERYRPEGVHKPEGELVGELDAKLVELYRDTVRRYCEAMDGMMVHSALEAVWGLLYEANFYVDRARPWELKNDPFRGAELDRTLRNLLSVLRETALMLGPVMPSVCRKAWMQLGNPGDFDREPIDPEAPWDRWGEPYRVVWGEPLFPRPELGEHVRPAVTPEHIERVPKLPPPEKRAAVPSEAVAAEKPLPAATETPTPTGAEKPSPAEEPRVEPIDYDHFAKIQLRVGQVLSAERVKKSDRLLKLSVDVGEAQPRQIVAGIAAAYEPEALVGRRVVVVANLKPRKIFGLESHGMLLVAQGGGRMLLLDPGEVPPGGKVS